MTQMMIETQPIVYIPHTEWEWRRKLEIILKSVFKMFQKKRVQRGYLHTAWIFFRSDIYQHRFFISGLCQFSLTVLSSLYSVTVLLCSVQTQWETFPYIVWKSMKGEIRERNRSLGQRPNALQGTIPSQEGCKKLTASIISGVTREAFFPA